jgi:uncharacterized protein YkwD
MKKTVVLISALSILGLLSVNYLKYEQSFADDRTVKEQAPALVQSVRQPSTALDLAVEDREYRVPLIKVVEKAPVEEAVVKKEPSKTIKTKPTASPKSQTPAKAPTVVEPVKTPEPAKTAEPVNAAEPVESSGDYVFRSDMEKEIFRLTNEIRVSKGLNALKWDTTLHSSARSHTKYMFVNNVFKHTTKFKVAENIILLASPQKVETYTAQYLVDKWMASEGHRANILNPSITRMGVGVIRGDQYFAKYDRELPAIYGTQHFK